MAEPTLLARIGYLLRHLLSIAILPFTMTILVPTWIARRYGGTLGLGSSAGSLAAQLAGLGALPRIPAKRRGDRPRWRPWTPPDDRSG